MVFLLFLACNPPCDVSALSSAVTGADVVAACQLPQPLVDWHAGGEQQPPAGVDWSCSVPGIDAPRIASRRAVFEACGQGLGDEGDFVYGSGQPYLAVAVADWAQEQGLERSIAAPLLGASLAGGVELPVVQGVAEPVAPTGDFSTLAADALVGELTEGPLRIAVQQDQDRLHLIEMGPGVAETRVRLVPGAAVVWEKGGWRFEEQRSKLAELVGPIELIEEPTDTIEQWAQVVVSLDRPVRGPSEGCQEPPEGMVCVPSGLRETDHGRVLLPSFYVDAQPVTNEDYEACSSEGYCKSGKASSLSFLRLEEYCTWQGKRPPTEEEWRAAEAAGALQGTGSPEWTITYFDEPQEEDLQVDPWGPCGGGYPCSGSVNKVVLTPTERLRKNRSHAVAGGRCATRSPVLATWPPQQLVKAPELSWDLTPLTDEQRALVASVTDDAIDEVPICTDRVGLSSLDCKDPVNHVVPNEERYHVVFDYITHRGGGYVGVASDQNYSFVVEAKSEYAWFLDYDAVIVHLHQVARAVFLVADTREDFVSYYADDSVERTEKLLDETYADDPDLDLYKSDFRHFRGRKLHRHFVKQMQADPVWGDRGWLRTEENYRWIRELWRQGRAKTVKGNMLGDNAMLGIADAARELQTPIRVYYTSNAPSAWGSEMTPSYKRNVRALPMDQDSIVVQVFGFKTGFGQTGYWHYNIQSGPQQQEHLGRYDWLWQVYWPSLPTDDDDVTVSGLPGAAVRKPVTRTYVPPTY